MADQPTDEQTAARAALLRGLTGMDAAAVDKFLRENPITVEGILRIRALVE